MVCEQQIPPSDMHATPACLHLAGLHATSKALTFWLGLLLMMMIDRQPCLLLWSQLLLH